MQPTPCHCNWSLEVRLRSLNLPRLFSNAPFAWHAIRHFHASARCSTPRFKFLQCHGEVPLGYTAAGVTRQVSGREGKQSGTPGIPLIRLFPVSRLAVKIRLGSQESARFKAERRRQPRGVCLSRTGDRRLRLPGPEREPDWNGGLSVLAPLRHTVWNPTVNPTLTMRSHKGCPALAHANRMSADESRKSPCASK